ncbi:probable terpene synthase 6 [Tripterygium wilfordii]|uniref:probable terpene synthase 6 n=1 Tax=Tripterygium wilfordii TaxID=458696 RepID=UPI0018F7FF1A|nr:probable terpene synthase 6 [Tripterygium wilfordii]
MHARLIPAMHYGSCMSGDQGEWVMDSYDCVMMGSYELWLAVVPTSSCDTRTPLTLNQTFPMQETDSRRASWWVLEPFSSLNMLVPGSLWPFSRRMISNNPLRSFTLDKTIIWKESKEEGRAYAFSYVKEGWKAYVRGNLVEAQWCNAGYVPTFDEYLKNGLITSCCDILPLMCFFVIGEIATIEAFEWLESSPKFMTASQTIACLVDDNTSHRFEQKRRHVASAVECYMKEYGITEEEEAVAGLKKMIENNAWKDINEEWMRPNSAVSMELLDQATGWAYADVQ